MGEYKRQYVADMKRKGWYKEPPKDSAQMKKIKESLQAILDKKLKKDLPNLKTQKNEMGRRNR